MRPFFRYISLLRPKFYRPNNLQPFRIIRSPAARKLIYPSLTIVGIYEIQKRFFNLNSSPLLTQLNAKTVGRDRWVKDMFLSIRYGQIDRLDGLLNSSEHQLTLEEAANQRHEFGWTLLQAAAINRNKRAVQLLLKSGADVNAGDQFSNVATVTHQQQVHPMNVYKARQDEFHESLSMTNSFLGFKALHYAVLADDIDLVDILINAGADPLLNNQSGHRPSEYALPNLKKRFVEYELNAEETRHQRARQLRKLKPIDSVLKESIVGQREAIDAVSGAIRRKESGWCSEEKPLVFLFLGSSGVGKTELAKQVAKYIESGEVASSANPKDHSSFVRIDMSEYQQKHEVSKFIGAPPGYVGYQEGGQLTEALSKNPNAVVLLDEIDKADTDVLTILLQLFDEGRLTDGQGKTVDGRKAIYVMTSNLANSEIGDFAARLRNESQQDDVRISDDFKEKVIKPILKRHFKRDEFLGRVNEIVYFLPFSRKQVIDLVVRELEFWADLASKKHSIKIEWDDNVVNLLADRFDRTYGARSLKHEVDRAVVSLIAKAHEMDKIASGQQVKVTTTKTSSGESVIRLQKMKTGLLSGGKFEDIEFE
ncbi:hypothetical protein ACOME3_000546 [Neoechinorhynchus agilis]